MPNILPVGWLNPQVPLSFLWNIPCFWREIAFSVAHGTHGAHGTAKRFWLTRAFHHWFNWSWCSKASGKLIWRKFPKWAWKWCTYPQERAISTGNLSFKALDLVLFFANFLHFQTKTLIFTQLTRFPGLIGNDGRMWTWIFFFESKKGTSSTYEIWYMVKYVEPPDHL